MLFTKPDSPLNALAAECERAAKANDAGDKNKPTFFTFDDLKGMFSLFDPTGRGLISRAQVQTGKFCAPELILSTQRTFLTVVPIYRFGQLGLIK